MDPEEYSLTAAKFGAIIIAEQRTDYCEAQQLSKPTHNESIPENEMKDSVGDVFFQRLTEVKQLSETAKSDSI